MSLYLVRHAIDPAGFTSCPYVAYDHHHAHTSTHADRLAVRANMLLRSEWRHSLVWTEFRLSDAPCRPLTLGPSHPEHTARMALRCSTRRVLVVTRGRWRIDIVALDDHDAAADTRGRSILSLKPMPTMISESDKTRIQNVRVRGFKICKHSSAVATQIQRIKINSSSRNPNR
jgi:hypothetical protein